MKRISLLVLTTILIGSAYAQPIIPNGNNLPAFGYSDSIAAVKLMGGAPDTTDNAAPFTWDFSMQTAMPIGKFTVMHPDSTPFAAQVPNATHSIMLQLPGVTTYEYDSVDANNWVQLASGSSMYAPNPKTLIPFPFSFLQQAVDTFDKVGSGQSAVTITYDGYGKLITPYDTFSVIRIKRDFGGGDYYYNWLTVTPRLFYVAIYNNNDSLLTFLGTGTTTSIKYIPSKTASIKIYPNPITNDAIISISTNENLKGAKLVLTDLTGRTIKEIAADKSDLLFNRDGLKTGIYFYSLFNSESCLARGKFMID